MKIDFKRDFYTGEKIDVDTIREKIKNEEGKVNGLYLSVISKKYHEEKYKKDFRNIILEFFEKEIPKCPITNLPVNFYLSGQLKFAKFSPECSNSEIQNWNQLNNKQVISFNEKMKIERKGSGNPLFGKVYTVDEKIKFSEIQKSLNQKRKENRDSWSKDKKESVKTKMKESAILSSINCPNRGMKNKTHSEASKEKMRIATIRRLKEGKFPQTDTSINRIFESLLNELGLKYEKEFRYGHFAFDFKVENYLIEIQGDYWHWNPNVKFKRNAPPVRISLNLKRDKAKRLEVERNNEYKFLEFWETDINNNLNDIKECLKKLFLLKK